MPEAKPHEFRDADETVNLLSKESSRIGEWFRRREDSLKLIVRLAVGPNTFRAFQNMPNKPSVVFREWALQQLEDASVLNQLVAIRSPIGFQNWTQHRSDSFRRAWKKRMARPMPYGPSRKLPNLLFKHLLWWTDWNMTH